MVLATLVNLPASRRLVNRGFHAYSRRRMAELGRSNPVRDQERQLLSIVAKARQTRFGIDHHFSEIHSVAEFQARVPLRTYEQLWNDYLKAAYPKLQDLTWPGLIPYFALTSGTTQGATKYIPLSREMLASNRKAARTLVATVMHANPDSRLFEGKLFFLGGSTDLGKPYPGVREGDLSAISVMEISETLRQFSFPPLELALGTDWDRKLEQIAARSLKERITLVSGVPSWLLILFQRLLQLSSKKTIAEVWPSLEVVVHGGVKFDPYQSSFQSVLGSDRIRLVETYPCSEGFIALEDSISGHLRLMHDHGIFYEFVPVDELDAEMPTRHWLGDAQTGVNYAIVVSTCAGMWGHVVGDTIRFEHLNPPLLSFTGRTKYTLSAFGEHLISEEVEAAMAAAARASGSSAREWHVGPVFEGALGYHRFLVEFIQPPADLTAFRDALDADLRKRNADYDAHRAEGVGLPAPELVLVESGGFESWMRSMGKLGGQHKVPRMDASGQQTQAIGCYLEQNGLRGGVITPRSPA
jgi:GH3 auxin-responsive promoter